MYCIVLFCSFSLTFLMGWHQPFVCLLVPCPDSFGFHCSNWSLFCMAAFSIYTRLFAPLTGWFLMFSASMRWWRLSRWVHCFSCWVSAVDHVLQRRSVLGFRSNEVISANCNQTTDGVKCSSIIKRGLWSKQVLELSVICLRNSVMSSFRCRKLDYL